jgi:hypothetical protein
MSQDQENSRKKLNCAREVLNFSSIENTDRFDKKNFNPEKFIEKLSVSSPNLLALLNKIELLDKQDIIKHRKLFKHFIFSDIQRGYGAKVIASGFVAAGYTIAVKAKGTKIIVDEETIKSKNESKFLVLSSTSIYGANPTPESTKKILETFNARPDNVYGDSARFIILDSGFKEGVDLFDVKYGHIFEDQLSESDLKQAIGRGTRFCGQAGLKFDNGWPLCIFNYKISFEETSLVRKILRQKKKSVLKSIQKKAEDTEIITKTMIENAVDFQLTKETKASGKSYTFEIMTLGAVTAAALTLGILKYRKELKK